MSIFHLQSQNQRNDSTGSDKENNLMTETSDGEISSDTTPNTKSTIISPVMTAPTVLTSSITTKITNILQPVTTTSISTVNNTNIPSSASHAQMLDEEAALDLQIRILRKRAELASL